MIDKLYYFTMIPMVYLAFAIFFTGIIYQIIRIWASPKQLHTLEIFPKQRPAMLHALKDTFLFPTIIMKNPIFWFFLMVFHVAFIALILGHLELIKEIKLLQLIPHEVFLGKGFIGIAIVVSASYFFYRRLKSPIREISYSSDYLMLLLLIFSSILGGHLDWANIWSESGLDIGVSEYREYLYSLITFKPMVPDMIKDSPHYIMLVLHIFTANLFIILFPFSKFMHTFLAMPLNRIRRGL
ncbi:MAG: respiratory nitrate reductase subunit gamma [Pseudomonadota bacterium]